MLRNLRDDIREEIWGVLLLSLAILAYLFLFSRARTGFAEAAFLACQAVFGQATFWIPGLVGAVGLLCLLQRGYLLAGSRAVGTGLAFVLLLGWLHRVGSGAPSGLEFRNVSFGYGGGLIGAGVVWSLREALGPVGRDVALVGLSLIAFLLATDLSLLRFARSLWSGGVSSARWTGRSAAKLIGAFERRGDRVGSGALGPSGRGPSTERPAVSARDERGVSLLPTRSGPLGGGARLSARELDRPSTSTAGPGPLWPGAGTLWTRTTRGAAAGASRLGRGSAVGGRPEVRGVVATAPTEVDGTAGRAGLARAGEQGPLGRTSGGMVLADPGALRTVPPAATGKVSYEQIALTEELLYELPPLTILDPPSPSRSRRARQDIDEKIHLLEEGLESFGVKGRVLEARRGPVVTSFEFQPAPGVKVSRIVSLADDIALLMASDGVRIEAPIPGKHAVGIEVPNLETSAVSLREVLEDPAVRGLSPKLTVVFGKDITGRPVTGDLDRLLHVLIAGATGSGKSVCINSVIASLLLRAKPSEVKLLLIDPKVVELSVYEGIPHLVAPVVTNPKKAAGCLRWAVKQMEERYELFAAAGVRDIGRYNAQIALWRGTLTASAPSGEEAVDTRTAGPKPLPFIVIVIDELADLMTVAPVDVEDAIWRLAQMARAAGIHLVVATQRPSVDVITGTIKANIPTRVAFAVSSQVDSRTIIDTHGAEKLVGRGDMLYLPVGTTKPIRVQGAYVSDREIESLVEFVKAQGRPRYVADVLSIEEPRKREEEETDDTLFEDAIRVVMETGQASISMLQRKLRVGYTRAGRLIDMMEEKGIVGPFEGSKAREILMTFDQYRRAKEAARRAGDRAAEPRPLDDAARTGSRPQLTLGLSGRRHLRTTGLRKEGEEEE